MLVDWASAELADLRLSHLLLELFDACLELGDEELLGVVLFAQVYHAIAQCRFRFRGLILGLDRALKFAQHRVRVIERKALIEGQRLAPLLDVGEIVDDFE